MRSRTVFEVESAMSGRVRVVDYRAERRLMVGGDILSVYPLDGNWARVQEEYWWRALTLAPPSSTALLIGLGGGTQVHLLRQLSRPQLITVIERDPVIVRVACRWFGLDGIGGLEFLCGDAERVVPALSAAGRTFDFVMEDAAYAEPPERAVPLARAVVPLVAPHGRLVINRHRRGDAHRLVGAMRRRFRHVRLRHVRRGGENVLICCLEPREQA
ncbi:MAG TPA: class I SAM-dependent methyltransferase [Methylomirabilota bacterium]|nr:class I SAM-dependent methyltransferase [Methylomirabilota bacterium]